MTRSRLGTLYGLGVGPGDPELVTVKAARLIEAADVVAFHSARHGRSIARSIAAPYLRGDQVEELLVYPVTTETTDHPGGYAGAMADFYTEAADRLAAHLEHGRDVALLAEGDPLFYSSFQHMFRRLSARFDTLVVPGVTSVSAGAAAAGVPLVEATERLAVLPATLDSATLTRALRDADAAVVMKVSADFAGVVRALRDAGRLQDAILVERASRDGQRVTPVADADPSAVPYMGVVVVPGPLAAAGFDAAPAAPHAAAVPDAGGTGRVDVVGLGPGPDEWLTPQAADVLARAEHVIGYVTYVDRVRPRAHQRHHASDNMAELERAVFALDLAARGARVAVVSSGDPGVFAMAAAVLEAASDPAYAHVPVSVVPGLTAAQAVASRVGAPLGHDFAVISLSDRLKPLEVILTRVEAVGAADLVVAIYNPASTTRRSQLTQALAVLSRHRDSTTPVVVGRAVGSADESVVVTTLAQLDVDSVDMRCLLIVGSSQTRVLANGQVFTPRSYPRP